MKKFYELVQRNLLSLRGAGIFKKHFFSEGHLPLITISREMGSGGRPIAFLVAKELGHTWVVYHREIVEEIAKKTNLEKRLISEVDENTMSLVEELIADVFGKRYLTLTNYQKHLAKILSTIGNRGFTIIVGRGAHYLFPHALKVRIISEMEQRIKWEIEYEHIIRSEAVKRIEESDNKRYEFERTMYGHDPKKAHHYDLVIRTGQNLSIENAAEIITQLAKRRFKL